MNQAIGDSEQGDANARHQALIDALREAGHITLPRVEEAFRAVPRHLFLPDLPLEMVYADEVIATKHQNGIAVSSSSQPAVMAIMLEQLDLQPGQHVLEIGAGTGYNVALMAFMVGEEGRVVTVDIDDDIVAAARAHLDVAGVANVEVVRGDGADGQPDAGPYDRIILTVGAPDIAPAWLEQLKPDGRLVLPLSLQGNVQKLVAFEREADHLISVSVRGGSFMPLRGTFASPETPLPLGSVPGLFLGLRAPRSVDAGAIYALLTGPSRVWPASVRADGNDIWGGVSLWLALHAPAMCSLTAEGEAAHSDLIPDAFAFGQAYRTTIGLCGPRALAVLIRPHDEEARTDDALALWVRSFGEDDSLAHALIGHLTTWEAAGRPSSAGLRVRAYPGDAPFAPEVGASVIVKKHTRLVLDWPAPPAAGS